MKMQWGSCSPAGRLTLNPHLVKAPRQCIDYVLLHELCHLEEHNHSVKFYNAIERHLPNWRSIKAQLDAMSEVILCEKSAPDKDLRQENTGLQRAERVNRWTK